MPNGTTANNPDGKDGNTPKRYPRVALSIKAADVLAFEALFQKKSVGEVASEIILNNCRADAFKAAGYEEKWVAPAITQEKIKTPLQLETIDPDNIVKNVVAHSSVDELQAMIKHSKAIKDDPPSIELIKRFLNEGASGTEIARRIHRSKSSVNEYIKKNRATLGV